MTCVRAPIFALVALALFPTGCDAPGKLVLAPSAEPRPRPEPKVDTSPFERLLPSDTALVQSALQETLETHRSAETRLWRNERSGRFGDVTPLRTFRVKSGYYCREFRETVTVDRNRAERRATACRTDDGTWVRVKG